MACNDDSMMRGDGASSSSMTDLERLAELAMRVEALTGPDSEVDAAIQASLAGAVAEWQDYKQANAYHRDGKWVNIGEIKPYTGSLDDSTTLFPADCFYRSGHDGAGPDVTAFFCDAIPSAANGLPLQGVRAVAETEALARTAAALKALAAKSREVG